jgi:thiosulfate/3-mercaptopyruvate sulfurtransferase
MDVLISPHRLAERLDGQHPPRLLDVRWSLDGPPGLPLHRAERIPGSVYVDLETELAGHGAAVDGRHPLPQIDDLTRAARSWGVNDGDGIVVYDDWSGLAAARAWWLLSHAGVDDVSILDGGLRAWIGERMPTAGETDAQDEVPTGDVVLRYGTRETLSIDEVAQLPARGVLLDARAGERYRGEVEPVDPRAGHIPGAISAPTTENLDDRGCFLGAAELRARFASLGIAPGTAVGVYCGSGVTAAHEIAALEIAGLRPALYPASFSQWSNLADREVAVGPLP